MTAKASNSIQPSTNRPRIRVATAVGAVAVVILLFCVWMFDGSPHSDPSNDFKRFVMGGPHWADEDKEQGYDPRTVSLPKSVEILKSDTFNCALSGEGAVLYFAIDQKDLDEILTTDDFEPTIEPEEKERLNYWSQWYLRVSTNDLGKAPSLYITKGSHHNVIRTLLAVNQEHTRAIFLHVNFN